MELFTQWYIFLRILSMDPRAFIIFVVWLSALTVQCSVGCFSDLLSQLASSSDSVPVHAVYSTGVPVATGLPCVPLSTGSDRRCFTREQLLNLNTYSTVVPPVSGLPDPPLVPSPLSPASSCCVPSDFSSLCCRLNDLGIHCRQLLCLRIPPKKAHRGHRRRPRLRNGAVLPTPKDCKSRSHSSLPNTTTPLRIALFNAQSVSSTQQASKRTEIVEFIQDNDLDILILTETWLKENGDDSAIADLTPVNYFLKSFPRSAIRGGGIAVIFKNSLSSHVSFSTVLPFTHPSYECVQVTLALHKKSVQLFCIYRPPPNTKNKLTDAMFFSDFHELLEHSNTLSRTPVLLGDINVHFDDCNHPSTSKMLDMLNVFQFIQSVSQPTHKKNHILDWVMHRPDDHIVQSVLVSHALASDHFCVLFDLMAQCPPPPPMFRSVRCLRTMNKEAFREELQRALISSPLSSADHLDAVLRAALEAHAPVSRRRVRPSKSAPWYPDICEELRDAKRDRRRAERKWLKTGLTVHKQIFNAAKNVVTRLVHSAKTLFLQTQISACTSSRKLFDVCSRLTGRSKVSPLPTVFPATQLPEIFSEFFIRKVADIRSELDQTAVHSVVPSHVDVPPGCSFLLFQPISEKDLRDIILKSKPTSCPLDALPTPLLLENLDVLLPTLTQIVNDSLLSGIFPSVFKTAIVTPLLKKPTLDVNVLKNYRPVSNLSFLSKITEKVVLKQLLLYLNSHDLISHSQSAYRAAHSTETALLKVTNDILSALDGGDVSVLTLLDLSAAFDTIDHVTLLSRLNILYGISGPVLAWFESYLTGRTQAVLVDGQMSVPASLSSGVPQGSVLGPILFIMYIKPLSSLIQNRAISNQSFADDTQLYRCSSPAETHSTVQTIQTCILDVKSWMVENKLKLNDDKTEALLCKKKTTKFPNDQPTSVRVGNTNIPFSFSARNLGFTITSDMTLDKHVSIICKSAYYELRKISSIRHILSAQTTNILVCSFVLSKLDYCNSLLSGCPLYLLHKLQKLQNCAARLVFKAKKHEHVTPLLRTLHWLPIQARIDYKLSTLCFHFFSGSSPTYISELLTVYTPTRQLRSSSDSRTLVIPHTKTKTYGQRTFTYCASTQWNSLPAHIRHSQSVHSFKRALKTHLFRIHYS